MKSAIALVATAALASATVTRTKWVYEVVTVTVTADATDYVQASRPVATPAPKPVKSSAAHHPARPAPPAGNAASSSSSEEPSSVAPAPASTSAPSSSPEPVIVVSSSESEPAPASTSAPSSSPEPVVVVSSSESESEPAPESQTQTQTPQSTQSTQSSQAESQTETLAPSSSYQKTTLDYHNAYRRDHSAPALEWDETLAHYAQIIANGCVFKHDMTQGGPDYHYGQNLASWGSTGDLGSAESAVGKAIASEWYPEVKYYNFYGMDDPPAGADFEKFGHFSQLVWKDSTKVGCASTICPAGTVLKFRSYYTVCNYGPPGNFQGNYGKNVLPSIGLNIDLAVS